MGRWLLLVAAVVFGGSSFGDYSNRDYHVIGHHIKFFEDGMWADFSDRAEKFHISVFTVLDPIEACGAELHIYHRTLAENLESWRDLGGIYRLAILESHVESLMNPDPDSPRLYFYDEVQVVESIPIESQVISECLKSLQ